MPTDLQRLISTLVPGKTILLFGSGSSVPSFAPSVSDLIARLSAKFKIQSDGYSLAELSSLIEQSFSRKDLVSELRIAFDRLRPTGGILNLPLYDWRSIYTTNYDDLIEQSYRARNKGLTVYSSDFDFTLHETPASTSLFKLHGSIEKDVSDGHSSRLIITESDYDSTLNYREHLYHRLRGDIAGGHLVIIGHSLADPDIRSLVNRAAEIAGKASGSSKISVLMYLADENRAQLFERRGISVSFGGIDDFFAELAKTQVTKYSISESSDLLDASPLLRPATMDVDHAQLASPNFGAMFNGRPATHADVVSGLTFERIITQQVASHLKSDNAMIAVITGPSGVGKTTAARQILQALRQDGHTCWEHDPDHVLYVDGWIGVTKALTASKTRGVLLIDEAHAHLQEINELADKLVANEQTSLRLVCVSTRNLWAPRVKTPILFKLGKEFRMGRLENSEIENLLTLVDKNPVVRELVERTFSGFSRYERRRRLIERCESEVFVCLKNIFASEKFDDIILREYASIRPEDQEVYRHVAALQAAGVHVHRQLIVRLLGIPGDSISAALTNLSDIVHEYCVSEKQGIYGWQCRHPVIAEIVAKYKYSDIDKRVELLSRVIDNTSPTYEIEIRSIRELCNLDSGLPSFPDKEVQNTLLRKMMSIAPGERVPRHRLIRNLIDMGEFEKAEVEIRIFEKDFGRDSPVARYKVHLLTARAVNTVGIMEEDRLAILDQARALAVNSIKRFPNSKTLLGAYCEVGIALHQRTGDYSVYDDAIKELKLGEDRIGDPEISKMISRYESRMLG